MSDLIEYYGNTNAINEELFQTFNDVIYNAVDFPLIPISADLIEQKENMVLYAGDFRKEKGILTLIQAMEGLDGARHLLIGEGEQKDRIKSDFRDRGLSSSL